MKLTDNVMLLGNGYFNFYVVGQEQAALIECGTRAGAAIFRDQWMHLENKPDVKYIVVLHSHFDHVCGVPVLKEMFPQAQLLASKVSRKILSKERIVSEYFKNDQVVSEKYFNNGLLDRIPETPKTENINIDIVVAQGDQLELDKGLKLEFLDAPGHSVCSIAAYLENDKVMFVSDAAGGVRPDGEEIAPVFFQDYDLYIASLKKLNSYPTEKIAVAHGDIPAGDKVNKFYSQSLQAAEKCFDYIKARLDEGAEEKLVAAELFEKYIKGGLAYYPEELMLGSMHLLINNVKAKI